MKLKHISKNQDGFINLCIPAGLGMAGILVAWPFWIAQMLGFELEFINTKIALYVIGPIIDILIVAVIGTLVDKCSKPRKYPYKLLLPVILILIFVILLLVGLTGLGC